MVKIILSGWKEGFEKVSLTMLQKEKLGMSLKDAKKNVDDLLDNKSIELLIKDKAVAVEFYNKLEQIGVIGKLIVNS
ncbi:MAG: hypothetical protein LBE39_08160 [Flavobacteriaceae bacterium]|jgi:hypothetical protein|uniref:hypothetical protein n=1 Tax=Elizabethkingia ursingii TaxID=1756150 RepID=UPI0007507C84|nr:hypothetical protein [Elizabethkingia ursingii]KUY30853.1 hypothetical protein ATB96_13280 [Elizabethkingia ursingii]MDR2229431.1 hypothetical protein [Flavobacteriaceae bacterium]